MDIAKIGKDGKGAGKDGKPAADSVSVQNEFAKNLAVVQQRWGKPLEDVAQLMPLSTIEKLKRDLAASQPSFQILQEATRAWSMPLQTRDALKKNLDLWQSSSKQMEEITRSVFPLARHGLDEYLVMYRRMNELARSGNLATREIVEVVKKVDVPENMGEFPIPKQTEDETRQSPLLDAAMDLNENAEKISVAIYETSENALKFWQGKDERDTKNAKEAKIWRWVFLFFAVIASVPGFDFIYEIIKAYVAAK